MSRDKPHVGVLPSKRPRLFIADEEAIEAKAATRRTIEDLRARLALLEAERDVLTHQRPGDADAGTR